MAQQTLSSKDLRNVDVDAAQKLVDFYEDNQLNYLITDLNEYRDDWKNRKFIPRVRNITKSIVDKSGLLFNAPPVLEIVTPGGATPVIDETFNLLMERSDWVEFFQNVDVYTRALKSTVILQQKYIATTAMTQDGKYVPNFQQGDALLLTLLTRANSAVKMDITGTIITEVAFLTSDITNGNDFTYRCITPSNIYDWDVKGNKETLVDSVANEDGFVPASFVYDTLKPRKGGWSNIPEDIISLQEMLNIALTDTEFAIAHQKQKTLFTNARVIGSTGKGQNSPVMTIPHAEEGISPGGTNYPQTTINTGNANMGGLGKVVTVQTGDPQIQPFVKFDGPISDLDKLTNVMEQLMQGVALDWSVTLRTEGTSSAGKTSGFQIIVEEMDNLQLRDKRGISMQAAMRRFYDICQRLYTTLTPGTLRVKFAPPALPVDTDAQEQMWGDRISAGRASVLDYFKEFHGLTEEEAWEKILEIQTVNEKLGYTVSMTATEQASGTAPPTAGNTTSPSAGANPTGNP
jgi:hypothetical protein